MSILQTTTSTARGSLSPSVGDTYFETDTKNIIVYDGSNWQGYISDGIDYGANDYSLEFDGTNDYINLNSNVSISGAFSISMWVYPDDIAGYLMLGSTSTNNIFLYANNSGTLSFRGGTGFTDNVVSSTNLTAGSWQHVVITRDGGFNYTFYRNKTSNAVTGVSTTDSDIAFDRIGANSTVQFGTFDGKMDELAFYNKELSAAEVASIYDNNLHASGLVAFYRFEDGSGTSLSDVVGSNDGTLTNFPATPSPWRAKSDNSTNTPY